MFKFCALIVMVAVFGSAIPSFAAQGQKQIRPVLQRTSMHDGLLAVRWTLLQSLVPAASGRATALQVANLKFTSAMRYSLDT